MMHFKKNIRLFYFIKYPLNTYVENTIDLLPFPIYYLNLFITLLKILNLMIDFLNYIHVSLI